MIRNRLKFSYGVCVSIEVIIASLIVCFTVLGLNRIVSLLLASSFIVAFVYVLLKIYEYNNIDFSVILVFLCFFHVTMNCLQESGRMNFDYYKKVIMFCCFVFFVCYSMRDTDSVPRFYFQIVEYCPVIIGTYLVFSYSFFGNTAEIAGGITLGFSNPNFTGMWLLHCFLYGTLFVIKGFKGGNKLRLLYIPILVIIYNMIPLTGARSCQISVLVFFACLILKNFLFNMPKIFALAIVLFPILFSIFYLTYVSYDWFQEMFSFMISEGKSLNTRVRIWNNAFEKFWEHPIFGNYSGISHGTGQAQMHNTHIDVLASYGIVPFIIFLKILYDSLIHFIKKSDSSLYQTTAYFSFCAVLISGSFEAAIVAGAMGLNLLTVGFLFLARNEDQEISNHLKIRFRLG